MSIIDLQFCVKVQPIVRGIGEGLSFGQCVGVLRFLACNEWEKMGYAITLGSPRKYFSG
jgi:hypothetical protein